MIQSDKNILRGVFRPDKTSNRLYSKGWTRAVTKAAVLEMYTVSQGPYNWVLRCTRSELTMCWRSSFALMIIELGLNDFVDGTVLVNHTA